MFGITFSPRRFVGIGSTDVSMSAVHEGGSKSKSDKNKKKDGLCPADGLDLPLSDTCTVEEGITKMEVTYEYSLVVDAGKDEDDFTHIISCNEFILHQAFVRKFCPKEGPKAKAEKEDKASNANEDSIVVSISSSPNDSHGDTSTCPDSIKLELDGDETCLFVSGGFTMELNLANASERRRLGSEAAREKYGMRSSSGAEWVKDGATLQSLERTLQEFKDEQKALSKMLKDLVKEMNTILELGLSKEEVKDEQKAAEDFVNTLPDDVLRELVSGDLKLDVSFAGGTFFSNTAKAIEPSEQPSAQPSVSGNPSLLPSSQPSISGNPSLLPSGQPSVSGNPSLLPSGQPSVTGNPSLVPSLSSKPSTCECTGSEACFQNQGEFVTVMHMKTMSQNLILIMVELTSRGNRPMCM